MAHIREECEERKLSWQEKMSFCKQASAVGILWIDFNL